MASRTSLLGDLLYFIKNDLTSNITDPISIKRKTESQFICTSFSQTFTEYPVITIKIPNLTVSPAGMQTDTTDIELTLEVRIWARNQKEKDDLYTEIFNRLSNIQFSTSGSIDNDFHDFAVLSSVEVDEEKIKSRIMRVRYRFFSS